MHYQRFQDHGDPLKLVREPLPDACKVGGCTKAIRPGSGKGYCPMHYQRLRQYGDPLAPNQRTDLLDRSAQCSVDGCTQTIGKYGNKGMCRTHARIAQRALRPAHYKAKLEARRKRVRQQTPPWADMAAIEAIYAACPPGHEVDHEVPLRGELVSGLHVPWNLGYLPVRENRAKGNRFGVAVSGKEDS